MKDKQRERMMGYFIEAAKEIVEAEGVESVSARKVGQEAGYSYATLYNYFSDFNHLLVHVAYDYMAECFEIMKIVKDESKDSLDQVVEYAKIYFKFFHDNPRAFELAYLKNIGGIPTDLSDSTPEFGVAMLLRQSLEELVSEGRLSFEKLEMVGQILVQLLHGKMLFYLTGKLPYKLEDVLMDIENEVKHILGG